ncbi:MAG: radical SAM protein [Acidilobaceae archaeon]
MSTGDNMLRILEPLPESLVYHYRPDALRALYNNLLRERLSWYYSVLFNEKPAKFLIARRIEAPLDPYDTSISLGELWQVHDKLALEHRRLWLDIREDRENIRMDEPEPKFTYLDVKIAIAKRIMESCELCEWRCKANRASGKIGVCRVANECMVYSFFHHIGEEAPLVPSGTIFYGGCPFRCVFCQNWEISQVVTRDYIKVTPRTLASIQENLARTGARNINHVGGEPTPQIPFILESLKYLNVNIAQLWNSDMHMTPEAMKLIKDIIDIWLPDFKYGNDECGRRLSKVKNYFSVSARNHIEAYEEGLGDMIIRHLVLPNHIECCTRPVLEWLSKNIPRAVLNLMDQYHPDYQVLKEPERYKDIARRLTRREFEEARRIARSLGYTIIVEDLLLYEY